MQFSQYKLRNGIRVILAPLQETKAVTVLVLVKVGSRYEPRRLNGSSHFVEHLMFKGTRKRPTSLAITRELDGIGAEYNAFTSKDHTGYYIKASAENLPLALEMLSDMIFRSQFRVQEVERERGVIIEEINMYNDNPLMNLDDLFEDTVYGDQPLGWNISGPKEVIQRVTRKDILGYYRQHYRPASMLVGVAGQLNGVAKELVERYFGSQPSHGRASPFSPIRHRQRKPQVKVKYKDTEQVQLGLGFPSYAYGHPKLYALYLMSVVLGGNMSSRLFTAIRDRKSLCYFIRSSVNVYEDTGNLMVQAGLDKKRIPEAIRAILEELSRVRRQGVTPRELHKARAYLKGKLMLELEASDHVVSWLARQELLQNRILTPAEQVKQLERVTLSDIRLVAKDIMQTKKLNLALIGPSRKPDAFVPLLRV
ncbi:MAG: pitrilysin family protein [Patescibacteria group bacterium]